MVLFLSVNLTKPNLMPNDPAGLSQLKTRQGTELLIQSEIDSVIVDWYRALTEVITTHVSVACVVVSCTHL